MTCINILEQYLTITNYYLTLNQILAYSPTIFCSPSGSVCPGLLEGEDPGPLLDRPAGRRAGAAPPPLHRCPPANPLLLYTARRTQARTTRKLGFTDFIQLHDIVHSCLGRDSNPDPWFGNPSILPLLCWAPQISYILQGVPKRADCPKRH